MTKEEIKSILKMHYVDFVEKNDHIIAFVVYTKNKETGLIAENVTNYSLQKLKFFLGY